MWALHRTRKLKKKRENERRVEDNFLLHKAKAKMLAVSQGTSTQRNLSLFFPYRNRSFPLDSVRLCVMLVRNTFERKHKECFMLCKANRPGGPRVTKAVFS